MFIELAQYVAPKRKAVEMSRNAVLLPATYCAAAWLRRATCLSAKMKWLQSLRNTLLEGGPREHTHGQKPE
jgi:hypothetical protein